ncbi:MAG: VOC family protein, partial [Steroidobacteraceae bacterium]
ALHMHSRQEGPPEILFLRGTAKRLHHMSFAIREEDLEPFADHLAKAGSPTASPPFGPIRDGLWFQDPWGTWVNLVPTTAQPPAAELQPITIEPRVDRHKWRELDRRVRPNRLGHALIFTPESRRAEAFYQDALGMRTSDVVQDKIVFLSGGSGIRDHHCFGLVPSTHRGLQHGSFHVNTIDDIGFGALQLHNAGYQEGHGPGRHALASNLFYYARDPWGSWIEYYTDMDKISETWKAGEWRELPYIWPHFQAEFWTHEMNGNHEPR